MQVESAAHAAAADLSAWVMGYMRRERLINLGRKFCQGATWFFAFSPFLIFVVFGAMAMHVRLSLGHWPKPMIEDFSSPYMPIFGRCIGLAMTISTEYAIAIWLLIVSIKPLRISWRAHISQVIFYLNSWFLTLLCCIFLPGDFISWYFD